MGQRTVNRNYYKPDINEENYGENVNQSFDSMDADVQNNINAISGVNADLQNTKSNVSALEADVADIKLGMFLLDKMVNGETLTIALDRKTCTSSHPFISQRKSVYIGSARIFDFTETLPNTIILAQPLDDVSIDVYMDYIRSDV